MRVPSGVVPETRIMAPDCCCILLRPSPPPTISGAAALVEIGKMLQAEEPLYAKFGGHMLEVNGKKLEKSPTPRPVSTKPPLSPPLRER